MLAKLKRAKVKGRTRYETAGWDTERVRALRRHLGLSQDAMAGELGTRQQTVSEWETGRYRPRGASARLLSIIAERAGFQYGMGTGTGDKGHGTRDTGHGAGDEGARGRRAKR
jgi:DNA-binding transcriptional regulator YiaG